jgi:5-methylcytosine-specific restriction endonuclease McrA
MPIRPQHRWLYPIDWQQLTDMVRFERAKGRCEQCNRPHGKIVCHMGDGRWWDDTSEAWRDDRGRIVRKGAPPPPQSDHTPTTRVYLATAHLDNNPGHNDQRNLKAFCQRCHIIYDRAEHLRRRRLRFLTTRALGDLFEGHYHIV